MLAHDVVGDGLTAVFLHGILGSRNNWRSFANKAPFRSVLCDLRNHGESHGLSPPHTIAACADDVIATVSAPDIVIGHSFGGKVALELARRAYARETWVLDCPPGPRRVGAEDGSEIGRVLEAVGSVPMPVESRRALVEILRATGLSEPLCQWMTTNIRERAPADGGGFVWRFDLAAIPEMLASFGSSDLWSVVESDAGRGRLVIVRGGRSDRWSADDVARLTRAVERGTVEDHVLPNAGHWLHTDDPAGLLALLVAGRA